MIYYLQEWIEKIFLFESGLKKISRFLVVLVFNFSDN